MKEQPGESLIWTMGLYVFGRPAEIRRISIPDQLIGEGKIDYLVYLSRQVVLMDDAVIHVVAAELDLCWGGLIMKNLLDIVCLILQHEDEDSYISIHTTS
jgi:hypothetical protein